MTEPAVTEHVVLLHGLWMRRPYMWRLASRLRAEGFVTHLFAYATLWSAPERSTSRLAALLRSLAPGPVHLVGHSLGGVTALATLHAHHDVPRGRVVCLGSPLAGSRAAGRMGEIGLGALVGRSRPLLLRGVSVPRKREVGVIAGSRGIGGGQWITRFEGVHDGTVGVSETRIEGLQDHLVLPVTHSGLVFSRAAAAATARFLRSGSFAFQTV